MATKSILIIDDNSSLNELFKDFFEAKGFCAHIAQNGQEGVEKYRQMNPDIVLMDVQMPVMNGYISSKGIKHFDPGAKILMVTGYPDDPLARKSLDEGFVEYVVSKPCDLNMLYKAVNTIAA